MLESLLERFDPVVVLDTETTGIFPEREEIIELGFLRLDRAGERELEDYLIALSEGKRLPWKITQLTGITEEMLRKDGVAKDETAGALCRALDGPAPLIAAYNAQFDLSFLWYFLARLGREEVLRRCRFLDVMTVYKDRRDYPHRLSDAVAAYGCEGKNSHRACDDAEAAAEVLAAMERERGDLPEYINLFGYVPKYGPPRPRISSVRYRPQGYDRLRRLYE